MSTSPFARQPYEGILTFAGRPHSRELKDVDVAIVGVPYDGATSNRSGARFGPRAIREQSSLLWGYNNAQQIAPFEILNVVDYGDVPVIPVDVVSTHRSIEQTATTVLNQGTRLISLGGDHSIALPLLRAHARKHGPLAVIHVDAHPDTWDVEFGDIKYSHGTPFRRAIEEGLIDTSAYLQIGIRGPTTGPQDYADAIGLGARLITCDEAIERGMADVVSEIRNRVGTRSCYLSFDIDAVDPAFAPGTGTPEVGGFTSHQVLQVLRGLTGLNVVGADLVEVAPPWDSGQITSLLASNLVFEILSLMARRRLE